MKEGPRRRTGGRSARVLDAVADAVLKELAESGIENFSIPAVAARAGVSSSSIYRRWPSKAALIAFSSGRVAQEGIPFPDRGSLRNDLLRVLVEVWDFLRDPKSRGLIALSFSVSDSLELQDAQRTFWNLRVEQQKVMFDRAIARGEIDESTDIGDVIERVVGPLYFRYFLSRRPVTKKYLEGLADSVLATLPGASPATAKSRHKRDAYSRSPRANDRPLHFSRRGARARSFPCAPGTRPAVAFVCLAGATLPAWLASCGGTPPQMAVEFDPWAERVSPPTGFACFPSSRPGPRETSPAPSRLRWTAASRRKRKARGASRLHCCAGDGRAGALRSCRTDTAPAPAGRHIALVVPDRLAGLQYEDHGFVFNQFWGVHVALVAFLTERHPLRRRRRRRRLPRPAGRTRPAHRRGTRARLRGGSARSAASALHRAAGARAGRAIPRRADRRERACRLARSTRRPHSRARGRAARYRRGRPEALIEARVRPAFLRLQDWLDACCRRSPATMLACGVCLMAKPPYAAALAQDHHDAGCARNPRHRAAARSRGSSRRWTGCCAAWADATAAWSSAFAGSTPSCSHRPIPIRPARTAGELHRLRPRGAGTRQVAVRPRAARAGRGAARVASGVLQRTAAASYTAPAPDGSIPGIFWIPLPGPRYEMLRMKSLAVHEAVPGHHFQLALLGEDRAVPRRAQRTVFSGGSANSEGWALSTPRPWRSSRAWYAARSATRAARRARQPAVPAPVAWWSTPDCMRCAGHAARRSITAFVLLPRSNATSRSPGRHARSIIGALRLRALRDEAQRALGTRFSLPAFHDVCAGGRLGAARRPGRVGACRHRAAA